MKSSFVIVGLGCVIAVVIMLRTDPAPAPMPEPAPAEAGEPAAGSKETGIILADTPVPEVSDQGPIEESGRFARSAAQPLLTLAGHLEATFARRRWGKGQYQRAGTDMKRADRIAGKRKFNPDGKKLSVAQFEGLQQLADEHVERVGEAFDYSWSLRKEAMIRSSHQGRFRSANTGAGMGGPHQYNPAFANERSESAKDAVTELLKTTRTALGVEEDDWRYTIMGTGYPDGVSKQVVVYFTREQEPLFFEAQDRLRRRKSERDKALKAYIDSL